MWNPSVVSWCLVIPVLAACTGKKASGPGQRAEGKPLETQAPEASGQEPAFPGQTRAPYRTANVAFEIQVIAKGLEHPWSVAFIDDDTMLVTERPGRLRLVDRTGTLSPPVRGVPKVDAR